jgi:hypothetical protein
VIAQDFNAFVITSYRHDPECWQGRDRSYRPQMPKEGMGIADQREVTEVVNLCEIRHQVTPTGLASILGERPANPDHAASAACMVSFRLRADMYKWSEAWST